MSHYVFPREMFLIASGTYECSYSQRNYLVFWKSVPMADVSIFAPLTIPLSQSTGRQRLRSNLGLCLVCFAVFSSVFSALLSPGVSSLAFGFVPRVFLRLFVLFRRLPLSHTVLCAFVFALCHGSSFSVWWPCFAHAQLVYRCLRQGYEIWCSAS